MKDLTRTRRNLPRLCKLLLAATVFVVFVDNLLIALLSESAISDDLVTHEASGFALKPKASKFVPLSERFHLSLLHAACLVNPDAIVTWKHGVDGEANDESLIPRNDPRVLDELRQCPDIDIYLPGSIRGNGYCEDGCAYTKYLKSRLLPAWVFEDRFVDTANRSVSYHELCPSTPLLFLNHYWDGKPDASDWPSQKPIYVMPNIEMGQLQPADYWRVDAVLCKTKGCYDRVTRWYQQEGNPRGAAVFYTRHTTTDIASYTRRILGERSIQPKNFHDVRFTHAAGSSHNKGTLSVVKCWLSRPDLPRLDLYMNEQLYDDLLREELDAQIAASTNIHLVLGGLSNLDFGRMMAESAFFLCPSIMEGYGHYINQARSSGGIIITANAHPMNELVPAPGGGIYAKTKRSTHQDMMFGGEFKGERGLRGFYYNGLVASVSRADLCAAVDKVLDMTGEERERMAVRAQLQYHEDTQVFAREMRELRAYARNQQRLSESDALSGVLRREI